MMNMGNNCGGSAFLREFYFTAIGFFIIYFYDFLQTNIDFIRNYKINVSTLYNII